MKHILLAVAALSIAGAIGTANAFPVGPPDNSISVEFWNLPSITAGSANTSPNAVVQQALPGARTAITGAGGMAFGPFTYAQPIFYNLNPGGDVAANIQQFFASGSDGLPTTPAPGCPNDATCGQRIATAPGFTAVTLYEFTFQTTGESFTISHDDGASLFLAGTEGTCTGDGAGGTTGCGNDLLPTTSSKPTSVANEGPITLSGTGPGCTPVAGCTYDLWYTSANGTPEVLETGTVAVPAPLIGHGLLALLAVGGVLFGGKFLEGLKKRHLHAA